MSIEKISVPDDCKEIRLDLFLAQNLVDAPSRTFIQKVINSGGVTINGKSVKSNYKVTAGEIIDVDFAQFIAEASELLAEDIPLDIFHEDDCLIVVNKPIGMLVHPAQGKKSGTLVNALLYHSKTLSDINTDIRPGIVHRLDRETSGLILIAKDNKTHAKLAQQFEEHVIKKKYLALVDGIIEFDEGMIDQPLGKHPKYHDKKAISHEEGSKEAQTIYRVVKRNRKSTLVALFPLTGRTHQLRVHMSFLRHSILGDDKYGRVDSFPRLALHAQSIGFIHPKSKKFMEFSSRPPQEFYADAI